MKREKRIISCTFLEREIETENTCLARVSFFHVETPLKNALVDVTKNVVLNHVNKLCSGSLCSNSYD